MLTVHSIAFDCCCCCWCCYSWCCVSFLFFFLTHIDTQKSIWMLFNAALALATLTIYNKVQSERSKEGRSIHTIPEKRQPHSMFSETNWRTILSQKVKRVFFSEAIFHVNKNLIFFQKFFFFLLLILFLKFSIDIASFVRSFVRKSIEMEVI